MYAWPLLNRSLSDITHESAETQIVETALLEAVNDSSKDDQAIVTDLINATIEVCTEQTNTLAGHTAEVCTKQTNTLAEHTAEVQAGLEAAGIRFDDAQGLQEATPEAKGVEGINPEELEQAAQATWEGLAMTGKFMGAVAKLAGAVSMCVAAYTAAIVGMAAATPATLLLTAMDNQSVNNAVVKVSEYLHSNVEQATKDLMASEFAMMTFGGIMTCAKFMKDSFAAINQKFEEVNATLAREATGIAQGIKETYKSIGDAFKSIGDAFKSVNTGIAKWTTDKWTAALAGYASVEQLEEAKEADRVQAEQRAEAQAMTERVAQERAAT
ncbi:UNVERIFIED_ORG: hypothetical protein C0V67_04785, partial [Anaplasma ovis]|uniref:hypothetical protein n=1 Tax=Anaplasma marginale TaxID=770 RepID=UPI000C77B6C3